MSEYIYGMIDYCYNGLPIIRGYCSYKTLIKYSKPHSSYQRTVNDSHIEEIKQYLNSASGYHFMPEVILSYNYSGLYKGQFNKIADETLITPISYLLDENKSGSIELKDDDFKTTFRKIKLNTPSANMLRISLPDLGGLVSHAPTPFYRLDGNHRLDALSELKLKDFNIPFCIILLADLNESGEKARLQTEMEIFHNINSKAMPLTAYEQYNGLFNLFTVDELKKFGEEFAITKAYTQKHKNIRFQNIAQLLNPIEDIVLFCIKFIKDKEDRMISEDELADVFSRLEHTYFYENELIRKCKNRFALVPYVYYCFAGQIQKNARLDAYNAWFIKNRLYDVKDFEPASMVEVFDSIYDIRKKQIFVAMPFKPELDFVFDCIKEVVRKINRDNNIQLLEPIRIDKQIVGFSYDIVEEILDNIKNAGLLIADLTEQNANVYYEAGFAQGLIRAKLGNTAKILYLISNPTEPDKPFAENNAKFDVQHYKMLPYKNAGNGAQELKNNLEKELKEFYCI